MHDFEDDDSCDSCYYCGGRRYVIVCILAMAERIYIQSELLSRRAEKPMYLSSKICPTCGNAKPPDPLVDKLSPAFRAGFIAAVSSPTKCEVIGKRLMAEFRDEKTSEPDKLQCFPTLFVAWAQKQATLTPESDRRRVQAIIESWQKYLGAIYPRVLEAFKK